MIVNAIEFTAMNNPVWWAMQRRLIHQRWAPHRGIIPPHSRALEIGCGSGHGAYAITELFPLEEIYAIDLDERMIARAKKRESANMHFEVGDASRMRYRDNTFDGVFDSGVMHHIPDWKNCLLECARVLKFGGVLFMMDFSIETFEHALGKIFKRATVHPYEDMYHEQELIDHVKEVGFEIVHYTRHQRYLLKNFTLIAEKK